MSIRSTRSEISVEKTPIFPCSVCRAVQESPFRIALAAVAPNSTHGQGTGLWKSRDRLTIKVGDNVGKPRDRCECSGHFIVIPECNV